jgi:hypothetical protein
LGCAALKLGLQPQQHRPHRHKKFHVRPEALGEGYEDYAGLTQSSPPSPHDSPPAASTPEVETSAETAPAPTVAALTSEWEKVCETGTRLRAARNALQIWFWGLTLVIMLVLMSTQRDWLAQVVAWLHQFPLPAQ